MPLDPAGNASLIPSYFAEPGTTIRVEQHNPVLEDIASMLSAMLVRDGRNGMVGNLDMGSFTIRNLAPGVNATDAATVSQGVPVGAVIDFAGVTAPEGWMLCFGQAVSRTNYSALYAALGGSSSPWGQGDGSTTFNLPDFRGRVLAGKDNMGGTAANRLTADGGVNGSLLSASGGGQFVTLTVAQMPSHNHGGTTFLDGAHSHTYERQTTVGSNVNTGPAVIASGGRSVEATGGTGIHQHGIPSQGGGQGHPNVQPTAIVNKIIKVSA